MATDTAVQGALTVFAAGIAARAARTNPAKAATSRRSGSGSSRSSGPAKTSSPLERHGARTLNGLRERVLQRVLTLAAYIALNHQLGRPSRALVDYVA